MAGRLSWRVGLAVTIAAVTLLWLCVAHVAAQTSPFRIIVTEVTAPVAPNSVIELADRLGYYAREGVRVELLHVQGTPIAAAALSSGQGDMANISTDTVLQLMARGQMDLRGVVSPNKALPYVIVSRADILTLRQLEGRIVGVGRIGSVDYLQMRNVLKRLGVNVRALRYLSVGQPMQRSQALAVGQIDATTMTIGSWMAMPNHKGLHVLVDQQAFAQAAPFITKLSVVSSETNRTKQAEIAGVVRATIKASRDFALHPEIWANAMAAIHPEIPRPRLFQLAKAYRSQWAVDGGLTLADIAYTTTELYKSPEFKALPRRVAPAEWVDLRYIQAAMAKLGPFPEPKVR